MRSDEYKARQVNRKKL